MKSVDPIRDEKKIGDMKIYLKGKSLRNYALFVVGINVALRISDLLKLTWSDVLDENMKDFKAIRLVEGKTKKKRNITLNKASHKVFREFLGSLDTYGMDDYVFKSREGENKPLRDNRH